MNKQTEKLFKATERMLENMVFNNIAVFKKLLNKRLAVTIPNSGVQVDIDKDNHTVTITHEGDSKSYSFAKCVASVMRGKE